MVKTREARAKPLDGHSRRLLLHSPTSQWDRPVRPIAHNHPLSSQSLHPHHVGETATVCSTATGIYLSTPSLYPTNRLPSVSTNTSSSTPPLSRTQSRRSRKSALPPHPCYLRRTSSVPAVKHTTTTTCNVKPRRMGRARWIVCGRGGR